MSSVCVSLASMSRIPQVASDVFAMPCVYGLMSSVGREAGILVSSISVMIFPVSDVQPNFEQNLV